MNEKDWGNPMSDNEQFFNVSVDKRIPRAVIDTKIIIILTYFFSFMVQIKIFLRFYYANFIILQCKRLKTFVLN